MKLDEITACGECCADCRKRAEGLCKGCIDADGYCQEWAQTGRCPIHACARTHGVQFCGLCEEFPCKDLPGLIPWNPNIAAHLRDVMRKVVPTLYLSDLDGTLLRSDQRTSSFTNETINRLVEKGMLFSYATARSFHTASKATNGLCAAFPVIVYNGAFIVDNATGDVLHANFFTKREAQEILGALLAADVQPIVYSMADGRERMSYIRERMHPAGRAFMDTRKGDLRDKPVGEAGELLAGDAFYFTCIEDVKKLEPLHELFREKYRCVYARDIYSDVQWLEIMPRAATKANAARQLADMLGCRRIVAFGDHVNDIDLFEIADEGYAVGNAVDALKAVAAGVIATNDEDGVARWLAEHIE